MLGTKLWDKNVYLISELPSRIDGDGRHDDHRDLDGAGTGRDDLPELARASRVQPAEALRVRYEQSERAISCLSCRDPAQDLHQRPR